MWFKKKSVLLAEHHYDTENSADGSTDMRTTSKTYNNNSSINSGLPSAADANDYFYLPALGSYNNRGQLDIVGSYGFYWSSSADPRNNGYSAYALYFYSGTVGVDWGDRDYGYRARAFE